MSGKWKTLSAPILPPRVVESTKDMGQWPALSAPVVPSALPVPLPRKKRQDRYSAFHDNVRDGFVSCSGNGNSGNSGSSRLNGGSGNSSADALTMTPFEKHLKPLYQNYFHNKRKQV